MPSQLRGNGWGLRRADVFFDFCCSVGQKDIPIVSILVNGCFFLCHCRKNSHCRCQDQNHCESQPSALLHLLFLFSPLLFCIGVHTEYFDGYPSISCQQMQIFSLKLKNFSFGRAAGLILPRTFGMYCLVNAARYSVAVQNFAHLRIQPNGVGPFYTVYISRDIPVQIPYPLSVGTLRNMRPSVLCSRFQGCLGQAKVLHQRGLA